MPTKTPRRPRQAQAMETGRRRRLVSATEQPPCTPGNVAGERVAAELKLRGKNNIEVATEINVSPATIGNWTSGKKRAMPENLGKLAKYLAWVDGADQDTAYVSRLHNDLLHVFGRVAPDLAVSSQNVSVIERRLQQNQRYVELLQQLEQASEPELDNLLQLFVSFARNIIAQARARGTAASA